MNKNFILTIVIALCCCMNAAAQAVAVFRLKPNDQKELSAEARQQLDLKIQQALAKFNALAGADDDVILIESKLVLNNSMPAGMDNGGVTMARGQLYLILKNSKNDAQYYQSKLDVHATVAGDMSAAQMEVIKRLAINNPMWGKFVTNGREKINEYYIQNGAAIMKKAEALYQSKNYEECKTLLAAIPSYVAFYNKVKYLTELCNNPE